MQRSTSSAEELEALKLPELRARCKTLGLTGYSKLTKALLIARLQATAAPSLDACSQPEIPSSNDVSLVSALPADVVQLVASETLPEALVARPQTPRIASQKKARPNKQYQTKSPSVAKHTAHPQGTIATGFGMESPLPSARCLLSTTLAQVPAQSTSEGTGEANNISLAEPQRGQAPGAQLQRGKQNQSPLGAQKRVYIPAPAPANAEKTGMTVPTKSRKIVSLVTKPATVPLVEKPVPAKGDSCTPHRLPGLSNSTFLVNHFCSHILRKLRLLSARSNLAGSADIMNTTVIGASEELFSVALRFWVSRLHTALQMGSGEAWSVAGGGHGLLSPDITVWPAIIDCKHLAGDLYTVFTSDKVTFRCFGSTGEVIHRYEGEDGREMRSDWIAYLASPRPLIECVKTKCSDEFPSGIHRTFRCGREEQELAERAALASCVLQSFSGSATSLTVMEAEWLGQPSHSTASSAAAHINLFLPESHQIMSVHLTCHPSVGIVHRNAGHSEYILRETGQIIGNEEGVVPLWQAMLGCDERGGPCSVDSFWAGWEERCSGQ